MILKPHPTTVPAPSPTGVTAPFWEGCRAHLLLFQRCQDCAAALFQPTTVCRACGSRRISWSPALGQGTIYSWSVVWRPPTPIYPVPFVVAIIDVDEGYQMMANIIGCDLDAVRIELPVEVEFHPIGGGYTLPYFSPRSTNGHTDPDAVPGDDRDEDDRDGTDSSR